VSIQQIRNPPVARPRPILEMTLHASVGNVSDLLDNLVNELVALVSVADAQLGTFLDIDNEGYGEPGSIWPHRVDRMIAIATEIALVASCDLHVTGHAGSLSSASF
jgi:hypothetical protein